ncbi:MAG: L,D-transpeptidase, partial [Gemmatimonadota bacterium]|nr:L,D-transpeptidase [Gemmatimonadota bacterium]
TQTAQPQTAQPQPQAPPNLRLEVNLAARELYVYRDGQRVGTHPVAVGSEEWPTQTGEWTIGQVIWNPRWIPPEEEWAEDEEVKEPGDPENPLGLAQLVYDAPRTVHGTNEPASLGKAVSHGSIRVANEVAVDLARQVMEAGGAGRDEAWYRGARENRTQRQDVSIPNPVPIRVVAGSGGGQGAGSGSRS